jgi:UDP:flavonoid glycosyltransferase YjiC (YdhE family)
MKQNGPVSVLIAPLDWGLGHATRCVPIIHELILQGAQVIIAAVGSQKALLKLEFPGLEFLDIPGYEIGYKRGFLLKWGLIFRIPAILKQIKRENQWLERTLKHRKIDAVISDNRFGLFHKSLYSVFITHQLFIRPGWETIAGSDRPPGILRRKARGWAERKILNWNYGFISKFSCCWVPDQEGDFSAAGKLSNPPLRPPVPVRYIGILSRFKRTEKRLKENSLLILLSGPEPQRTQFENILFRQLADSALQTVVVRGLPAAGHAIPFIREDIIIYNHLPAAELNGLLNDSEFIVARSGYSTIMDLLKVKKNAILVPTTGQPEQEYLGVYMNEKKWMFCVPQKNFSLEKVLNSFQKQKMTLPVLGENNLKTVIEEFLKTIRKSE